MLQRLRRYTREQRLKLFNEFMQGMKGRRIRLIDLGGTVDFWERWGLGKQPLLDVTVVNNHSVDKNHSDDPIRYFLQTPNYEAALERLENYYPLTARDVRSLFPQARIVMERPLGVPMSIIAMSHATA
jgi:hypothetical protein